MKILKSMLALCVFACSVQSVSAQTNSVNYSEMVPVSSSFFDFSSVSEVDKRRFKAVRRTKFKAAMRRVSRSRSARVR